MHRILPAPASLSTAAGEKIDTKWETGRRAAERERSCPPLPGVPLCPKENVRVPLCPRWPPSRRCLANARSARPRAGSEIGTRGIKTALHRNQQPNNRRKSNCRKHQRAACKPNRKRCYQSNGQYSVTALTAATGTIAERYAYEAYGKVTVLDGGGTVLGGSAYGNRYTYTGREWDGELGLYHYRARMYDPVAGRFCSRDPIGYAEGLSLFRNYFSLRKVDPKGTQVVNCAALHGQCLACVKEVKEDCEYRGQGYCFIVCTIRTRKCRPAPVRGGAALGCYGLCIAAYLTSCDEQVMNGTAGCNAALAYCNANGEWPGLIWRRRNRLPVCI